MELTRKQTEKIALEKLGRHWTEKRLHFTNMLKSMQIKVKEEDLEHFMDVIVPSEEQRHYNIYLEKTKSGELQNKYTPTDKSSTVFKKTEKPVLGKKYHLSWAYKASVFVLRKIEGEYCYVSNPKYNKEKLIKTRLDSLRELFKYS